MQGSGRYLESGNLEAYLRDVVAGRHCSRNRFESEEDRLNKSLIGQDLLGLRLW